MPKPVCVPCGRFFRPSKNGKKWVEMKPKGGAAAPPGNQAPDMWTFYKAWVGDEWQCQGCGTKIIVGHAGAPFAQDYMPPVEGKSVVDRVRDTGAFDVTVNDC